MYRRKFLAAFDFDGTIIMDDTDMVAMELMNLRDEDLTEPCDFTKISRKNGWLAYMQCIFDILREYNIFEDVILEAIRNVPAIPGMIALIKTLHNKHDFDIIIISDANTLFINTWLAANGLTEYVRRVIAHKAEFSAVDASLRITPYEPRSACQLGSMNMCKGQVLDDYIAECRANEALVYRCVFYVGDGINDVCPVMRLSDHDFAFPRDGLMLDKHIERLKSLASERDTENVPTNGTVSIAEPLPDATVLPWRNIVELSELILESIPSTDEDFPFLLTENRERKYAFVL